MLYMLQGVEANCVKSIRCGCFKVKKEYETFYNKRTNKNS